MKANLVLQENTKGTDWVVGDIHGCYDKLMWKLAQVNFDFDSDRLICSGDLIDRGEKSRQVVELLDDSWFYSTLGNHELMCIDAYKHDWASADFCYNGGMWFYQEFPCDQDRIMERLLGLPLTIRFKVGDKRYLVVHARVPGDDIWNNNMASDWNMEDVPQDYLQDAVWNRHFTNPYNKTQYVGGYDVVFCGHTVLNSPGRLANYVNLDTGVVFDSTKDFVFYNTQTEEIV